MSVASSRFLLAVALKEFEANYAANKLEYKKLKDYLGQRKLLKADSKRFDKSGAVADYIYKEATRLGKRLRLKDLKLIYELTDKNALIFAKIMLSHYRRLERYFMFFAEGRIRDPKLLIQSN
jgi:hypothetical protein